MACGRRFFPFLPHQMWGETLKLLYFHDIGYQGIFCILNFPPWFFIGTDNLNTEFKILQLKKTNPALLVFFLFLISRILVCRCRMSTHSSFSHIVNILSQQCVQWQMAFNLDWNLLLNSWQGMGGPLERDNMEGVLYYCTDEISSHNCFEEMLLLCWPMHSDGQTHCLMMRCNRILSSFLGLWHHEFLFFTCLSIHPKLLVTSLLSVAPSEEAQWLRSPLCNSQQNPVLPSLTLTPGSLNIGSIPAPPFNWGASSTASQRCASSISNCHQEDLSVSLSLLLMRNVEGWSPWLLDHLSSRTWLRFSKAKLFMALLQIEAGSLQLRRARKRSPMAWCSTCVFWIHWFTGFCG